MEITETYVVKDRGTTQRITLARQALVSGALWIALMAPNLTVIAQSASPVTATATTATASSRDSNMTDLNHSSPTDLQGYPLPPPFTPKEFFAKLVRLLKETNGYVTYQKFEDMFGIKTVESRHRGNGSLYEAGTDWYFRTLIGLGDTFDSGIPRTVKHMPYSFFTLVLPVDAFGDWKQGACVLAGEATKALVDSGWKLTHKKVSNQYDRDMIHDEFEMGKASLAIKHYVHYLGTPGVNDDATCVTEISVRGEP